jgi:hypothetical protein
MTLQRRSISTLSRKKMEYSPIFMDMASQNHDSTRYYHRPISTTNWRSFNNNTWNQGKENYVTTNHQ